MADWWAPPKIKSPSQCPGTARSATSAGRSLIMTLGSTKLCPRRRSAAPTGQAQRSAGAQTRGQLAPQRPAALDIEGLVDGLMGDPHRLIMGEVDHQAASDLLGAPRLGPAPLEVQAVATSPRLAPRRPGPGDLAAQALGHVAPELVVGDELCRLGSSGAAIGVRLGCTGPIGVPVVAPRRVAMQLAEMLEGDRPSVRATARTPRPWATKTAISSARRS